MKDKLDKYREYRSLLGQLYKLIGIGEDDTPEAEEKRGQMDVLWDQLTPGQQRKIRVISAVLGIREENFCRTKT